jgi:tellurite resistance protein TehA-like permease
MTSLERQSAGSAALAASVLLALSLACTLLAVRWFTLPNLLGLSGQDVLAERDFWCVLASVAFALGASVVSFRHALVGTRPASGSVIGAALVGVGVACLLLFLWWQHLLSATEPSPRTRSANRR